MKFHFITSIVFAVVAMFLAISDNKSERLLLLIPLLVLYYLGFVFFSVEYDKENIQNWRNKERKVIEDTYEKFFQDKRIKN
jgi:hypothetical protein